MRDAKRRLHSAPLISLMLMVGIWVDNRLFHAPIGDATSYHARVRESAARLPRRIGGWVGVDVGMLQGSAPLIKPNLVLRRHYRNAATGEQVALMIVQSRDARDMGSHLPSLCYPALGAIHRGSVRRDLEVGGLSIPGSLHRITDRERETYVYHFFVRPDGVISGGRAGVQDAAGDPRLKAFGAAQFHLELDASMSEDRRDEVCRTLLAGAAPVLEAIRGGAMR